MGPEHARRLDAFFEREWGGGTREGADKAPAISAAPQWVCMRNEEVIGYLGTIPAVFRIDGARVQGHWLKGFWVTEAYRSGPVGPMLVQRAVEELDLIGSQVVAPAARRVLESCAVTHRCTLFDRVLLLRPARVLGRMDPDGIGMLSSRPVLASTVRGLQATGLMAAAGAVAGLGIRLMGTMADLRSRSFTDRAGWDVPPVAIDDLWARLRDQVRTSQERDARYVLGRYSTEGVYDFTSTWREGALMGWAVVRRPGQGGDPRLSGLKVALISDLLFPIADPFVGAATLRGAERFARQLGADALVCSGSHPELDRLLARRGYVALPGTVQVHARDAEHHRFGGERHDLWITRGDARSDEAF